MTAFFIRYEENQRAGTRKQILQVANVTKQQPNITSHDSCLRWDLWVEVKDGAAKQGSCSTSLPAGFMPGIQGSRFASDSSRAVVPQILRLEYKGVGDICLLVNRVCAARKHFVSSQRT